MSRQRGRKVYSDPRWKVAREFVIHRADWKCERCGRTDRLEVHHIDPVKNRDGEPIDADFDPSNLEALCRPCHFEETGKANRRPKTRHEIEWDSYIAELTA